MLKLLGFPGGSDSKGSACNAAEPGLILGWEAPLEGGTAAHSSVLAGESHGQRSLEGCSPLGYLQLLYEPSNFALYQDFL